jgi:hypothetical protein
MPIKNVRKSLNKAFLKIKSNRTDIDHFKSELISALDKTDTAESEEFNKNILSDFLKKSAFGSDYFINTHNRTDLVIHNGSKSSSSVGVMIETKSPSNKSEMLQQNNINRKALHELLLYFLRERITNNNLEIKHLIATNSYEWFIFDAQEFERCFVQNKDLLKAYKGFDAGQLSSEKTKFFYDNIAKNAIAEVEHTIEYTHFDMRTYEKELRNKEKEDDKKLIPLYKILSPEHLLKLPFANDSNSLDKKFYSELLHIIGLEETKEKSKKVIKRRKEAERHNASLLENAIDILHNDDLIGRMKEPAKYGDEAADRLFNVGLELCITWVNRILFLKLLEAQLLSYHKGDPKYKFLHNENIKNYDSLNHLFFAVLAKRTEKRSDEDNIKYAHVPYLNSSLFEISDIEDNASLRMSGLQDDKKLPILSNTVLKDNNGKRRTGDLDALEYLFAFLNAYDFSSEGGEEIQEENKTLINASVLGLIFEKINGYKDGSFFTPGFITMYMCRETISRAVIQKFNEAHKWECETLLDVRNKIEDPTAANSLINSLKICDPAVGSGHFLVSALNELIAIKHELGILQDAKGGKLRDYEAEVINDELVITVEGELFEYRPKNKESQRVQETLFHEKQTLIENCLFGVDINPNSVKICQLRLWIELLKNAYYKNEQELETLPNIDINIKTGNSLISRFALDSDLSKHLKKSKFDIEGYRAAVQTYRHAADKSEKREMLQLIKTIKEDFTSTIYITGKENKKLRTLRGQLFELTQTQNLFGEDKDPKKIKALRKKEAELNKKIDKWEAEKEAIRTNKIYEQAFEWRFEFPEVLNNDGDFIGFDVVIGNPPYIVYGKSTVGQNILDYLNTNYSYAEYNPNTYALFTDLALDKLLGTQKHLAFIIPNSWLDGQYFSRMRSDIYQRKLYEIVDLKNTAFDEVVETTIIIASNEYSNEFNTRFVDNLEINSVVNYEGSKEILIVGKNPFTTRTNKLIARIEEKYDKLGSNVTVYRGLETRSNKIWLSPDKKDINHIPILLGKDVSRYSFEHSGTFVNFIKKEMKSNANEDMYYRTKILMRRTGSSIIAALDTTHAMAIKNLYIIFPDNEMEIYSLLSQLNSKLFSYIHRMNNIDGHKAFAQFKGSYIESLPYVPNEQFKKQVVSLTALKKENPTADTTALEAEIDQLVYELYELTPEEIKLVEESVN